MIQCRPDGINGNLFTKSYPTLIHACLKHNIYSKLILKVEFHLFTNTNAAVWLAEVRALPDIVYTISWCPMAIGHLENGDVFWFFRNLRGIFQNKWIIKLLKNLKEGHPRFFILKSPSLLFLKLMRVYTTANVKRQLSSGIFKIIKSWMPHKEVIWNRHLMEISVRCLWGDSW